MTDMVEKVGIAICNERTRGECYRECVPSCQCTGPFDAARAAIEALMDPTEEMCAAAFTGPDTGKRDYQAMLRAALGEGE